MSTQSPSLTGLTTIKKTSIKDQTIEQLRRYILSGAVGPGERLPSERTLSETLGVGRYSVREALRVLEAVGLIESRIGEGTFLTTNTGASFGRVLGLGLATWGGSIMEILDARRMIEIEAARTAARRATEDNLRKIAAELDHLEAATDSFKAYLHADMNFHRYIGEASQNAIITQVVGSLIDLLEEVLKEAKTDELPTQMEGGGTHRAIFEAISRHDSDVAANLMRDHILFTTEVWQAIISLVSQRDNAE